MSGERSNEDCAEARSISGETVAVVTASVPVWKEVLRKAAREAISNGWGVKYAYRLCSEVFQANSFVVTLARCSGDAWKVLGVVEELISKLSEDGEQVSISIMVRYKSKMCMYKLDSRDGSHRSGTAKILDAAIRSDDIYRIDISMSLNEGEVTC
ncbi:MAG TPA: hypothetical protein PK659_10890 [Methanothrix sp.]|nr:hypothetical protein [Methanothrix sp.]HOK59242.1 hypothetical protein [Methanothrix sp.]HOL44750.1 hypothetical protein [Methanothrix sp.]HPO89451.1 hypothetical protein [Methanothrix sp.]